MSGHDPYKSAFEASLSGVQSLFPWLSRENIVDPPHAWFDAALARQIVIHLMVRDFDIPKRRVVEMQGRSREAVNRALATIEARRAASAIFDAALTTVGADALSEFAIITAHRRNVAVMTGRGTEPLAGAAPACWYDETVKAAKNGGLHG